MSELNYYSPTFAIAQSSIASNEGIITEDTTVTT
jgi:hypothetical protein